MGATLWIHPLVVCHDPPGGWKGETGGSSGVTAEPTSKHKGSLFKNVFIYTHLSSLCDNNGIETKIYADKQLLFFPSFLVARFRFLAWVLLHNGLYKYNKGGKHSGAQRWPRKM